MPKDAEESISAREIVRKPDPIKDKLDELIEDALGEFSSNKAEEMEEPDIASIDKDAIGFENIHMPQDTDRTTRKLLYLIVSEAIRGRATDLYFELFGNRLKVRYVIDGVPYETPAPPRRLYKDIALDLEAEFGILKITKKQLTGWEKIVKTLKHMVGLGLFEPESEIITKLREFNDGDLASVTSRGINFNLMKVASKYGLQYRLKIFRVNEFSNLEDLFPLKSVEKIREGMLKKEKGLVLVAGAPNSGRTTTLYHLLSYANNYDKVSVAIGRCYAPESVHQFLVRPTNLNYADTLKAIRNLNPNVVLLDNIEDSKTAKEAIYYASSGALVLASVPSNDAITGINYLLSLGVNSSLLADSLQGVIGQTLVRKICDKCKEEYKPHEELLKELKLAKDLTAHYGEGCDECRHGGYLGRIPISQVIGPEDKEMGMIKTELKEGRSVERIAPSLQELGKEEMFKGLTTIEELLKI
ncbi:Flp pilus assembly complex ATPase component TadA [Candidatus Woesearchaeota archaeon]|nr:Flp pilus assembly complex ATPase component TadA [Candidatus Woesearchaeota archaeon]